MSKHFESLVLLLAFIQKQSAYLNIFSCVNSDFKGTQISYQTKISSIIKRSYWGKSFQNDDTFICLMWRHTLNEITSQIYRKYNHFKDGIFILRYVAYLSSYPKRSRIYWSPLVHTDSVSNIRLWFKFGSVKKKIQQWTESDSRVIFMPPTSSGAYWFGLVHACLGWCVTLAHGYEPL